MALQGLVTVIALALLDRDYLRRTALAGNAVLRALRGLMMPDSTFSRLASRFSFKLSFGSFFALLARGVFPDMADHAS